MEKIVNGLVDKSLNYERAMIMLKDIDDNYKEGFKVINGKEFINNLIGGLEE